MTHGISTNYSLPSISNTLTSNAISQANATSSTGSSSGTNSTDIGSTFLNLLTQELQNQDPTAPMDSTAMVGQMISLNSLSQLISINQTLSNATGASTSSSASSPVTQQVQQQSATSSLKDTAAAAVQAAASSANPLAYLFPMGQLSSASGTSAANISAAQSALLTSPSAIR